MVTYAEVPEFKMPEPPDPEEILSGFLARFEEGHQSHFDYYFFSFPWLFMDTEVRVVKQCQELGLNEYAVLAGMILWLAEKLEIKASQPDLSEVEAWLNDRFLMENVRQRLVPWLEAEMQVLINPPEPILLTGLGPNPLDDIDFLAPDNEEKLDYPEDWFKPPFEDIDDGLP